MAKATAPDAVELRLIVIAENARLQLDWERLSVIGREKKNPRETDRSVPCAYRQQRLPRVR